MPTVAKRVQSFSSGPDGTVSVTLREVSDGYTLSLIGHSSFLSLVFSHPLPHLPPPKKKNLFTNPAPATCVQVLQADYGLYTWPSSFVLARHLWRHRARYLRVAVPTDALDPPSQLTDRSIPVPSYRPARVLELGAGTALPGLLLAKLGARVTLTDAADQPEVLANLEAACRDNGLEVNLASPESAAASAVAAAAAGGAASPAWATASAPAPSTSSTSSASGSTAPVSVCGLSWGTTDAAALRLASCSFDLIVGADVFYSKGRDFDRLLATVRLLLERSEGGAGVFVTAYQHRSAHRSLEALLQLWGLEVRRVWQPSTGEDDGDDEDEGGGGCGGGSWTVGATVDVVEIVIASEKEKPKKTDKRGEGFS